MGNKQCTVHPNLDYPTPRLSECKTSQATPIFTKATWVVAIAKFCKILQNSFQSSKQHGVPKMYWLLKRNWVFASSWLQIDPIRSTTEVDDQLQSQKLKENVRLRHGHGKKTLEDRCAAEARWALYFWFGPVTEWESHACYQANVEVGFCSIQTVEKFLRHL